MIDVFTFLNENREPSFLASFADHLQDHLNDFGKLNLLAVAIRIAPHSSACEILDAALCDLGAGQPGAAFLSFADEAADWTNFASLPERKYYLAAIWQSLSYNDQGAFWRYAKDRAAA